MSNRIASLLLIGAFVLIQGCNTPLVDVKVTACEGTEGMDGKGICNPWPSGSTPYTGSAYGFYIIGTNPAQFYTGTGTCSGGKKCASSPGRCANGKTCISQVSTSNMNCKCDCAP
jgi:hypothetical protein